MVDLDAALGEQLLQIPVLQSVAQVPAHSDQDGLRCQPEPSERATGLLNQRMRTTTLHPGSLGRPEVRHGRHHSLARGALNATAPSKLPNRFRRLFGASLSAPAITSSQGRYSSPSQAGRQKDTTDQ